MNEYKNLSFFEKKTTFACLNLISLQELGKKRKLKTKNNSHVEEWRKWKEILRGIIKFGDLKLAKIEDKKNTKHWASLVS